MRSVRAALTSGLACNAPSTTTEAIVARASSAVTSWAMVARPSDVDVQHLSGCPDPFEILAAVMTQPEVQAFSGDRFPGHLAMPLELIADGGSDPVGPVGVKSFPHQQIDMAEINIAKVDRDLFRLTRSGPKLLHVRCILAIRPPSRRMVHGEEKLSYKSA